MKQTIPSKKERPLLAYAISKLNPEVFTHPVWMRFGKKEASSHPKIIENLLGAAQNLQNDEPSTTCQILLICAVCQNDAGQNKNALKIVQQALALAEYAGLVKETVWCAWGVSATCFQEGYYEQTARYLAYLQDILSQQNEWVLADFVDIVRQSLPYPDKDSPAKQSDVLLDQPSDNILNHTFNWLQQWGLLDEVANADVGRHARPSTTVTPLQVNRASHPFSVQQRQGFWHTLKLAFRGKLKLHWVENDAPPVKRELSFWRSILNFLHLSPSVRETERQIAEDVPQTPDITISPPVEADSLHNLSFAALPASKNEKISEQTDTVIPMTVQMLGTFGITIQDSSIKLHATRGLSLLKYLLLHRKQGTPREVLMDIFWPDAEPETARNNLNVAMHGLRRALRTSTFLPVIVFEDGAYGLAPILQVWLDVEEFERCIKAGQRLEGQKQLTTAVIEYEIAVNLYRGDFLADTPYEGWTVLDRERLRIAYLDTLDHLSQIYFGQERYAACATTCQLILNRDLCREDAHCRLMRCYSRLGQGPLALRQYQICVDALQSELEVDPAPDTKKLYERIRRHEYV